MFYVLKCCEFFKTGDCTIYVRISTWYMNPITCMHTRQHSKLHPTWCTVFLMHHYCDVIHCYYNFRHWQTLDKCPCSHICSWCISTWLELAANMTVTRFQGVIWQHQIRFNAYKTRPTTQKPRQNQGISVMVTHWMLLNTVCQYLWTAGTMPGVTWWMVGSPCTNKMLLQVMKSLMGPGNKATYTAIPDNTTVPNCYNTVTVHGNANKWVIFW